MSNKDWFRDWINYFLFFSSKRYPNVPGAIVENSRPKEREMLKTLTSKDIDADSRRAEEWTWLETKEWAEKQAYSKLLQEFDKKIIK